MNEAIEQFQKLLLALINDVERCRSILAVWPTPFSFRIYAHATFALFEGSARGLKQASLALDGFNTDLGNLSFFTQKQMSELNRDNLAIADNMKLGLKCFAKAMGQEEKIDLAGSDWENFRKAVKLRNQLIHPKSAESLDVSQDQMDAFIQTVQWFQGTVTSIK